MPEPRAPRVAIIDYGMGNLFSVLMACQQAALAAEITSQVRDLLAADAVILPGVGAFGDAMQALRQLDLVAGLQDVAAQGKPLLGICLGLQLLMSESHEFGCHEGLNLLPGTVVRLPDPIEDGRKLKVPQVGWNQIRRAQGRSWEDSCLAGLPDAAYMYFVHSFIVQPRDPGLVLSSTCYGQVEFCSSLQRGEVFGCQFHPERSGPLGLCVYRNLAARLRQRTKN